MGIIPEIVRESSSVQHRVIVRGRLNFDSSLVGIRVVPTRVWSRLLILDSVDMVHSSGCAAIEKAQRAEWPLHGVWAYG
jgi:hypothetical protein